MIIYCLIQEPEETDLQWNSSSLVGYRRISLYIYIPLLVKYSCLYSCCCFKIPAFSERFHFPRAVQMNMELKTDVGSSMLLHKGKWGIGRERRGRWQGPREGTFSSPRTLITRGGLNSKFHQPALWKWTPNRKQMGVDLELGDGK